MLHRAFDLGINCYDTAPSYTRGTDPEMVGTALKGGAKSIFFQQKSAFRKKNRCGPLWNGVSSGFQTDYVDVLVWHGLHSTKEISDPELFDFMSKMKKEGKARFTGFSAHSNMASVLKEAAKGNYHDVALVSYNFTHSKIFLERHLSNSAWMSLEAIPCLWYLGSTPKI